MLTDTLGLLLAVLVTPAYPTDRDAATVVYDHAHEPPPGPPGIRRPARARAA
ncbi:hypothetical protein [Streptomyces sp. NPDC006527]|uniref:hypothetical protein n=1 Tax=Streptomyces sp. NPDC006527 TaxID=3364749 RepID=UPI00369C1A9E